MHATEDDGLDKNLCLGSLFRSRVPAGVRDSELDADSEWSRSDRSIFETADCPGRNPSSVFHEGGDGAPTLTRCNACSVEVYVHP